MKYLMLPLLLLSLGLMGQTPGLIVKKAGAGQPILDPNNDGYISIGNDGFTTNDETQSELPFVRLVLPSGEPTSDLASGPACGFTDLVDNGSQYSSAYTFASGGNWLFRFRLGSYATNTKGYSILVDTDSRFGNTGTDKDPNYVTGNPGFEIEIILVTNVGVRLYDVDGTTTPVLKTTLFYADYSQKSVALSANCSNADFFYDFYIPFATITASFPTFSAATPVRLVANTAISTQPVIQGGPSDIAGANDQAYGGNYDNAWTSIVNAAVATAPNNLAAGFPPVRSTAPTVNSPLTVGATSVSGTSSEADGTTITVYVNGLSAGTTTVSGGTWSASVTALALGAAVTATATVAGKSVSFLSGSVTVGSTCSLVPAMSCTSQKGIGGLGPSGAAPGTTIRVYGPDNPNTLLATLSTSATNTFLYNCAGGTTNCTGGGPNCIATGVYWITAQETGKCESPKTLSICIGTSGTVGAPVLTTNPITPSTTSVTGTTTAGNTVFLFVDNALTGTTIATGGNYMFSGQSFTLGQSVSVRSLQNGACISNATNRSVTEVSATPLVGRPITVGATSVSGTSREAPGTTITVYKNAVSVGTTTVDANGNWIRTGLAALAAGDLIRATAMATGKSASTLSTTVTVQARSATPAITGSYNENAIIIAGSSATAGGTLITLYQDGIPIGTTTVFLGGWSILSLSFELYADGVLTATATESGKAESLPSAPVTISCTSPLVTLGLNLFTPSVCINRQASIQVLLSQPDVVYTLRDVTNSWDMGNSALGTGLGITLVTDRLTASQNFAIQAVKIPNTSCAVALTAIANVNVTQPNNTSGVTTGDYYWTGSNTDAYWTTDDNWIQKTASGFQAVLTPPSATDNVMIKPATTTCVSSQPSVVTTSSASLPATCKNLTIASGATLAMENTAAERTITLTGNWLNQGTFIANTGTIKFAGGVTQTITKSTTETFYNLAIEGTSTLLRPAVDINTTTLTLTSGTLSLNSRKVNVLGTAASAITRVAGMVRSESQNGSGELLRAINNTTGADYLFPMGTGAGVYIPLTVRLNSGNIGTVGVATYNANQASSGNWPTGAEAVTSVATPAQAIRRYWHLGSTQPSGSYNATVTFSFASTEDPTAGILDVTANGIKMQRWDGTSAWNTPLPGQVFTNTSPARSVSVPGITQFSWWSGGNLNKYPLPVELLYFKGRYDAGHSILTWATASESNNDKFIIERSSNGTHFQDLGAVPGAGSSLEQKTYTYTDTQPMDGFNYYRLRQVDFNGDTGYSNVVFLDVDGQSAFGVTAYPSPSEGTQPKVSITSSETRQVTIRIYDYLGYTHFTQTLEIDENTPELIFDLPNFERIPTGLYFIKATSGKHEVLLKMVKN